MVNRSFRIVQSIEQNRAKRNWQPQPRCQGFLGSRKRKSQETTLWQLSWPSRLEFCQSFHERISVETMLVKRWNQKCKYLETFSRFCDLSHMSGPNPSPLPTTMSIHSIQTLWTNASFRSVVVITSASHAEGRQFKSGRKHIFVSDSFNKIGGPLLNYFELF